ncbi:HET-domain-containing protein [Podospora aff. communis PSN243]|uniref:HET-domain-containing protein n=1 Tax=Podospora aff. communis PSN243 TaxID=3040156 RepID=A0AAV9GM33_9PEZI|nr:HET-domain-containing protein [Podospora aff. communis PSN243]
MRLLEFCDGKFRLTKNLVQQDVPEYAILSHTWGPDDEEVTFRDVVDGTGEHKSGWQKIRFCADQARRDGLKFFWVDTCCIDKSDLNELSRSINSMFRWYQNATQCYVFLSGISVASMEGAQRRDIVQGPAFRSHRWFTRGWTLQELVAPPSVEFFTEDGQRLGDKRSLEQKIHEITGIAVSALRGTALSEFSVEERFKWAEKRQTTHEEDWAYCLLGIFGIFMPLIYGEGRKEATRRLKKEVADAMNRTERIVPSQDAIWMVPFERNPFFTGRKAEMRRLRQLLDTEHRTSKAAITGLGGVGKTQIALELLHLMKHEISDCSIFWLAATSKEALDQSFHNAARRLELPGCDNPNADIKGLVQTHLSGTFTGNWLLVFDNADDITMWLQRPNGESRRLIDYLPKSDRGSILFTTRDKKVAVALAGSNVIHLSEMDEAGSETLLRNHLIEKDIDDEDVRTLLSRLTYLPLAIVQAAAYINANVMSLGDYLSLLEDQEEGVIEVLSEDFEDETRYPDVDNPVATTWLISFEHIRAKCSLAADYLCMMACVEPKDIPRALLPAGPSRKQETDAMGTLRSYSFITMRSTNSDLTLHRLVHLATRNWLRKEGLMSAWKRRVSDRLLELVCPVDPNHREGWKPYLPHIHHVLALSQSDKDDDPRLLNTYGSCLRREGRYREAGPAFERAVQLSTRVLGPEHNDTLLHMLDLAGNYRLLGQWEKCEELCVRIKEPLQAHPDVVIKGDLILVLASVLQHQGRYVEAEELLVQMVEMFRAAVGADHAWTLNVMLNLSDLYSTIGRDAEAESLDAQVMEAGERALGADNPVTLDCMERMSGWCQCKGQWEEAERLLVRVVETWKRRYGESHIDTSFAAAQVARVWMGQGRVEEAITLLQGCVDNMMLVLGPDHVETVFWVRLLAEWQSEGDRAQEDIT